MEALTTILTVFLVYVVAHASTHYTLTSYSVRADVCLGVAIAFGVLCAVVLVLVGGLAL